jgi:hypothetical protein
MELNELQEKGPESPLRYIKAQEIQYHVKEIRPGTYEVPSQTHPDHKYIVRVGSEDFTCSCPDFLHRGVKCKHVSGVELFLKTTLKQSPAREGPIVIEMIDLGGDFLPPIEDKELSDEEVKRLLCEGEPERVSDRVYAELY